MKMRLLVSGILLGVLTAQAFHSHKAHEGGIFAPHVDCGLCWAAPRTPSADAPGRAPAASSVNASETLGVYGVQAHSAPPPLPFGRGPPSLPQ